MAAMTVSSCRVPQEVEPVMVKATEPTCHEEVSCKGPEMIRIP